jgi:1,4-dihydroxy-2-naphthoate octaprenyltransferase
VLGRKVGLAIYVALLVGASLTTAAAVVMGALPWPALLPLITARTPIRLVGLYLSHEEPRALDRAVRGSAGLHARFNLLLALGIALGPMVGWVHATL